VSAPEDSTSRPSSSSRPFRAVAFGLTLIGGGGLLVGIPSNAAISDAQRSVAALVVVTAVLTAVVIFRCRDDSRRIASLTVLVLGLVGPAVFVEVAPSPWPLLPTLLAGLTIWLWKLRRRAPLAGPAPSAKRFEPERLAPHAPEASARDQEIGAAFGRLRDDLHHTMIFVENPLDVVSRSFTSGRATILCTVLVTGLLTASIYLETVTLAATARLHTSTAPGEEQPPSTATILTASIDTMTTSTTTETTVAPASVATITSPAPITTPTRGAYWTDACRGFPLPGVGASSDAEAAEFTSLYIGPGHGAPGGWIAGCTGNVRPLPGHRGVDYVVGERGGQIMSRAIVWKREDGSWTGAIAIRPWLPFFWSLAQTYGQVTVSARIDVFGGRGDVVLMTDRSGTTALVRTEKTVVPIALDPASADQWVAAMNDYGEPLWPVAVAWRAGVVRYKLVADPVTSRTVDEIQHRETDSSATPLDFRTVRRLTRGTVSGTG